MLEISVIMPVYNTEEKYLRESIESILNQKFQNFEFIIVNDGSANNAEDVILSYKDKRIVYIKNEKNLGVSASANIAIKAAKGNYIARMDSDDVAFPERLQKQYEFLKDNPQYNLCATRTSTSKGDSLKRNLDDQYIKAKITLRGNCIVQPTVMFNRLFFEQHNLYYDESLGYGEDWELWFRLSRVGRFVIIPNKLLYYRLHPNQANKIYSDTGYEISKGIFERNIRSLGFEFNDKNKDLLLNFLMENHDIKLSLNQYHDLVSEVFRLLSFVKETKCVSYKYAIMILLKKLISYTKRLIKCK